jgi:hypothetical protein
VHVCRGVWGWGWREVDRQGRELKTQKILRITYKQLVMVRLATVYSFSMPLGIVGILLYAF